MPSGAPSLQTSAPKKKIKPALVYSPFTNDNLFCIWRDKLHEIKPLTSHTVISNPLSEESAIYTTEFQNDDAALQTTM